MSSAPLTNSPLRSVNELRKRSNLATDYGSSSYAKRPRYNYYYILASESSPSEDEGSESVDSIQDKETDYCKDTSDTDTKSEQSDVDMNVEYEVIDTSDSPDHLFADGSSSGEEVLIAASAVAATIANDSDITYWATDGDENDETDSANSYKDSQLISSQICRMCRIRQTVNCFALCAHCYQVRKLRYPPRPRRTRPNKPMLKTSSPPARVTKGRLSAYLNDIATRDSGLASSQDTLGALSSQETTSQLQTLAWDQVLVPQNLLEKSNLKAGTSASDIAGSSISSTASSTLVTASTDSSSSSRAREPLPKEPISSFCYTACHPSAEDFASAARELCMMCSEQPKNGIFVHGTSGHMSCCYDCAKKFWAKWKRCPWCNLKAKNVVKAFISS